MASLVGIIAYRPASVSLMLSLLILTVGATTRCPFRGLYVFPPSSTTTSGGIRGASRRTRVPTRRGVAYPMVAGRRWYQSQRQSPRISAV